MLDLNKIASSAVQDFIRTHEQSDEGVLVLKHKTILGLPSSLIAEQIVGKRKAKNKIPLFYNTPNIIYPPTINVEQCSSELTAKFKATILKAALVTKNSAADLTGGFGVDGFFLSRVFLKMTLVEPNQALLTITQHNHILLGAKNITHIKATAEEFLKSYGGGWDCIYLDPSRRDRSKKIFRLTESEPNIVELLPLLFKKANYLLVKVSPLLDLQQGISELNCVERVFVVSVENECKEVLFLCRQGTLAEPTIEAVNIFNEQKSDTVEFKLSEERSIESSYSNPLTYLYEPNASILKAGAFKLTGKKFNLFKLQKNTHFYTSHELITDFPGRIFKILSLNPDSRALKTIFPDSKANVLTRNYPLRVEQLKKKLKLKDGGEKYLLGFSGVHKKFIVVALRHK